MGRASGKFVGIDIGGTKVAIGLVEAGTWRVLKTAELPTEANHGPGGLVARLVAAVGEIATVSKIRAVGLGFAGVVETRRGRVVHGPNFGLAFDGCPLARELQRRLKVPVSLDNDVRCFTLAEARVGIAKGKASVFGLTLGTGIGGALVIGGEPYRGRHNAAGEVGHLTLALGSELDCGCGQAGHFEAFASGSAVCRLTERLMGQARSAGEVLAAADAGDRYAKAVVEVFREGLATGLANLAYAYDPDVIVLGGGLAPHEGLWRPAVARARERLIFPGVRELVVRRSRLGCRANIIGAAMLAAAR